MSVEFPVQMQAVWLQSPPAQYVASITPHDGFMRYHLRTTFTVSVLSLTTIPSSREYSSHLMEEEVEAQGCDVPKVTTQLVSSKARTKPVQVWCSFYHTTAARNCPVPVPFHPSSSPQSTTDIPHIPFVTYFSLYNPSPIQNISSTI